MKKPSRAPLPSSSVTAAALAQVVGGNSSVVGTSRTVDPTVSLAGTQIGNPGSSGLVELDRLAHWGVGNG